VASRRVLLSICLSAALIVLGPAVTLAAGTVDQQVTTNNNAVAAAGAYEQAQVYTAGITGDLDHVDLYLSTGSGPGSPAADLTVTLWTVTAGAPDHATSTSATVLRADVPAGQPKWVSVPLAASNIAGRQWAIVLSSPGSSLGDCPDVCWQWFDDDNNPYAGGGSFWSTDSAATWPPQNRDYDFKTYVIPWPQVQVYLSGVGQGANGSVTSTPTGINCGATCLAPFAPGKTTSLTAHPATGASFGYWQGGPCDQSHNAVCSFAMPATDVVTTATFYGIEPTLAPTPKPSATAKATTKPTAQASVAASAAAASLEPSVAPPDGASPSDVPAATLAPGATPGPTAIPAVPASGDGSSSIPLILGVVLLIVLVGGGSFYLGRRRQAGAPPPPEA